MKNTPALERQWHLLHSLEARRQGATLPELAAEAAVDERTIQRDLRLFRKVGMPVEYVTATNGRKLWKIAPDHPLTRLGFTPTEAAALCLGFRLLEPLAGTYLWDGAQSATKKIRSCLTAETLRYFGKFGQEFILTRFGRGDYSKHGEIIDALMLGIEENRYTSLTYQSQKATEPATRDVYPHALAYHRGSLYLIAWSPDHKQFKNYKVDRVTDAETLDLRFQRDPNFSIERYLTGAFGIYQGTGEPQQVQVRFTPEAARYVKEKHWHESQQLKPQKDGSLIAEFHLTDPHELQSWILSFGAQAELLKPSHWRTQLANTLQSMSNLYNNIIPKPHHESENTNKPRRKRTPK